MGTHLDKIKSKNVRRIAKKENMIIRNDDFQHNSDVYTKAKFLQVFRGYDMCEDWFVVRTYIQKRYDIDHFLFEILLKLMGLGIFTSQDYQIQSKNFTYNRLYSLIDLGYVVMVMDSHSADDRIYKLSIKGRNIVINFYEYLVGEKKIPVDSKFNPMVKSDKTYDKKKMNLIEIMNSLPTAEHKRFLWEE